MRHFIGLVCTNTNMMSISLVEEFSSAHWNLRFALLSLIVL